MFCVSVSCSFMTDDFTAQDACVVVHGTRRRGTRAREGRRESARCAPVTVDLYNNVLTAAVDTWFAAAEQSSLCSKKGRGLRPSGKGVSGMTSWSAQRE